MLTPATSAGNGPAPSTRAATVDSPPPAAEAQLSRRIDQVTDSASTTAPASIPTAPGADGVGSDPPATAATAATAVTPATARTTASCRADGPGGRSWRRASRPSRTTQAQTALVAGAPTRSSTGGTTPAVDQPGATANSSSGGNPRNEV